MNDSSIQSKGGDTGPSQSNELTERLLRRGTEPIGVIDTIAAQRQYHRTTDWLAQRFSMLNRWKSRYAIADDAGESSSLVLAKSQQPRVMTMPAESAGRTFPEVRTDQAGIPASIDAGFSRSDTSASRLSEAHASPSSPPAQFRVSRRRADASATTATPETEAINNISSNSVSEKMVYRSIASPDAGQSHPNRSADDSFNLKTSEIRTDRVAGSTHHDSSSMGVLSPLAAISTQPSEKLMKNDGLTAVAFDEGSRTQPIAASLIKSGLISLGHDETPSAVLRQPRAVEVRAKSLSPLPDTRLQLQRSEKGPPLARSRELSNSPAYSTAAQVIQRASVPGPTSKMPMAFDEHERFSKPDAQAEERTMFSDEAGSSVGSAESFAQGVSIESAQPAADLPLSTPLIQRQYDTSSRADETASSDAVRRSAEIPAASSQEKTTMIWRQAAQGSSPGNGSGVADNARNVLPLTVASSGVSLARQSASVQSAGTSTSTEAATPMAASSANQIDMAGVAEQVWRLISRRLEVERERRGR